MMTYWFRILSSHEDQTNFYNSNENIRYNLMKNASEEAVIWHYTCVEKPLKIFFAKYYGQWTNLDGYYTNKRKFLLPNNLGQGSNNTKILLMQFLIAVKTALISERTLIFPDTVVLYPINRFPGVRTFSIHDIEMKGIDYVEPTFFYNRQMKHRIDISSTSTFNFSTKTNETMVNLLKRTLENLEISFKWKELVVLDFSQFNTFNELSKIQNFDQWWKNSTIRNDRRNVNISNIRLCRNIYEKQILCLKICK
jgi:hypothetical protein